MGERERKAEKGNSITEGISYFIEDGVCYLFFGGEGKFLTFSSDKLESLYDFFSRSIDDKSFDLVVIQSLHESVFLAGADVYELVNFTSFSARVFSERGHRLFNLMEFMPKIIVAVVRGYALGGGFDFLMACDLRIGTEKAVIGQTACKMGIITGFGGTKRLPLLVGATKAKELFFRAKVMSASEAYKLGVLNCLVSESEIEAFLRDFIDLLRERGGFARYKPILKTFLNYSGCLRWRISNIINNYYVGGLDGVN